MTETPLPNPRQNLADLLIQSGMDLLETDGVHGLTLRKAAARAGVSHAAPAHHFAGLPGLLTAIAGRAFQMFVTTMQAQIALAPPDPMARLQATCQGYLDFARHHSGLFHLMFVDPLVDRGGDAVITDAAQAYQLLRDACRPFSTGPGPDLALETAVWSMVHGYAALGLDHTAPRQPQLFPPPPFAQCLAELMAGRAMPPLAAPDKMG